MVGHDSICCSECGACVRVGELCFGWHECAPGDREAYLVERLRRQLDSGEFIARTDAWVVRAPARRFFDYAVWRRANWHPAEG